MNRFRLIVDEDNPRIVDDKEEMNCFFVACSGFGLHSKMKKLAEDVTKYLNENHQDLDLFYKKNKI